MISRAVIALAALGALRAYAQPTSVWVEVAPSTDDPEAVEFEETEKRYTPELVEELESAKADALLLYTEFSARASQSMKHFFRNVSRLEDQVLWRLEAGILENATEACRSKFKSRLEKIEYDARRSATFSGDTHHKFFLGHMVVFRMHLNKSEEYVKKCEKAIRTCGIACETSPKIKRWRRLAAEELHRVRDDLQHSRKMYRDILIHAQRRLNTLKRRVKSQVSNVIDDLRVCVNELRGIGR